MTSYFPEKLSAGERGKIDGIVTASNANPESVWDEAYITAKEDMTIGYVKGTARIYNDWDTNTMELGSDLFTAKGAFIGLDKLDGIVLGCEEFSGMIYYNLRTVAEGDPIPDDVEQTNSEQKDTTAENTATQETVGTTNKVLMMIAAASVAVIVVLAIVITKLLRKNKAK